MCSGLALKALSFPVNGVVIFESSQLTLSSVRGKIMEFPFSVTPDSPKWPVKRKWEGIECGYIKYGIRPGEYSPAVPRAVRYPLHFDELDRELQFDSHALRSVGQTVVFSPGDFSSAFFKNPFGIELQSGRLLVGGDVRYESLTADHRIDIAIAISDDGGLTWPRKSFVLQSKSDVENGMFMDGCILEAPSGVVHLFAVYFESANYKSAVDPEYDFVHVTSEDGGITWSDIKSLKTLKTSNEDYFFQCGGNGLVMSNGTLVVPCVSWKDGFPQYSTIIYSTNGIDWTRPSYTNTIINDCVDCQVSEIDGDLVRLGRRPITYSPTSPIDNTLRFFISSDMGTTWETLPGDSTLKVWLDVSCSLVNVETVDKVNVLLNTAMYYRDNNDKALGLQMFLYPHTQWRPVGIVANSVLTRGNIVQSVSFGKLFVFSDVSVNQGSALTLYDISRYFPCVSILPGYNVNLGFPVTIEGSAQLPSTSPLKFRYDGRSYWIGGFLEPRTGDTFSTSQHVMFAVRIGWPIFNDGNVVAFGQTSNGQLYPFLFKYEFLYGELFFSCLDTSKLTPSLAACTSLYFPESRIGLFC